MKKLPVLIVLAVLAAAGYFFISETGEDNAIAKTIQNAQVEVIESQQVEQAASIQAVTIVEAEVVEAHQEQTFIAGKDYVVIDKPVPTDTGDKVEVRELFWYYCPHCYNLEPWIYAMEETLTDQAEFVRQPSVLGEGWISGAFFFYVLKDLEEFDRLHTPLFDAIHKHKIKFNSQEEFVNWLGDNGVDIEKANMVYSSFSVESNVRKAIADTRKYQSRGVPTLVVNGKYWVDATHAGSIERIFEVVDYLIEKELH